MQSKPCNIQSISSISLDKTHLNRSEIEYINHFETHINADIERLNTLIMDYNDSTQGEAFLQKIESISAFHLHILRKYPPEFGTRCEVYRQVFQIDLHKTIQEQRDLHNTSQHNKKHGLLGKGVAKIKENIAPPEEALRKKFPSLLNPSNPKKQKAAFTLFFGETDEKKPNNYKLRVLDFIQQLKSMDKPKQSYNQLIAFRKMIQTALLEENLEGYRGKILAFLIALINTTIETLQADNPEIGDHPVTKDSAFPTILAKMQPEHLAQLAAILADGEAFNPLDLYAIYSKDKKNKLGKAFIRCLNESIITFLGGNNSKNFQVTDRSSNACFVLKIDNRLNAPKNIEHKLMTGALKDTMTPVYAERQVTFRKNNKTFTRTLLFTAFCAGGDLIDYAMHHLEDTLARAAHVYTQMAEVLATIQQEHCALPDGKNTNWLVDEKGKLRIADTKSFLPTTMGFYIPNQDNTVYFDLLSTTYMNPPEFLKTPFEGFDADHVHAYALGKNIYQYITRCSNHYLTGKHDGKLFDYTHPLFKTPEGNTFAKLIKGLVKDEPSDRMLIADALNQLQTINKTLNPTKEKIEPASDATLQVNFDNDKPKKAKKSKQVRHNGKNNHPKQVKVKEPSIPNQYVPEKDEPIEPPQELNTIYPVVRETVAEPIQLNNPPPQSFITIYWRYIRPGLETLSLLILIGTGAGIGSIVPGFGTVTGAAVVASLCLSIGLTGIGTLRLLSDNLLASASLVGLGMPGIGATIGALLGALVFPGFGIAAGVGIGVAIGFGLFLISVLLTAIKRAYYMPAGVLPNGSNAQADNPVLAIGNVQQACIDPAMAHHHGRLFKEPVKSAYEECRLAPIGPAHDETQIQKDVSWWR